MTDKYYDLETIQDMERKIANLLTQAITLAKIHENPYLINVMNCLLKSHTEIGNLMIELEKYDG